MSFLLQQRPHGPPQSETYIPRIQRCPVVPRLEWLTWLPIILRSLNQL